jgi:hypothetical protein
MRASSGRRSGILSDRLDSPKSTGDNSMLYGRVWSRRSKQYLVAMLLGGAALIPIASSDVQEAGLTQLTTAQLRTLLPGSTVTSVTSADHNATWVFGCDGSWRSFGGRGSMGARYTISDSQYCLEIPGHRACFWVFRAHGGALFMQKVGFGPGEIRPLQPIVLKEPRGRVPNHSGRFESKIAARLSARS